MNSMIVVKNVTKYFGRVQALKNVSFEINKGEIVGFLGENGAGKTTIMRILTSYLPATSGKVVIDDPQSQLKFHSQGPLKFHTHG